MTWILHACTGRTLGLFFRQLDVRQFFLGGETRQISPAVIKRVGKQRVIVVATKGKLQGIDGGVLRVDIGDEEADTLLGGYIKVVTDYREWRLLPAHQ